MCHHRLETHFSDGTPRPVNAFISMDELKALDMYYNRPPEELIFVTKSQHNVLHLKGRVVSEEQKENQSRKMKGRKHTEEHNRKIGLGCKGKPNPKNSENLKGRYWYNNGIVQTLAFECPEGYVLGRLKTGRPAWNKGKKCPQISEANKGKKMSEEARRKISEANKGEKNSFYGKQHTEEVRRRISEALKGKKRGPFSEETKRRMREAWKKRRETMKELVCTSQ